MPIFIYLTNVDCEKSSSLFCQTMASLNAFGNTPLGIAIFMGIGLGLGWEVMRILFKYFWVCNIPGVLDILESVSSWLWHKVFPGKGTE